MDENNIKKVLIVEDEQQIAQTLSNKINSSGFTSIIAHDGEEGLKIALEQHPDAILLDLILPKMDGMSLLQNLREDEWGKNVPVLILSNLGTGDEIEKARNFNVNEFLIKTEWRLDDVVAKISSLFG